MKNEAKNYKGELITLTTKTKPNLSGRIKIFLWNAILFPIVRIVWENKNEK